MVQYEHPLNTPGKDFFISYAIEDRKWARWVKQCLEEQRYQTIFPERDFPAGSNFVVEMSNALKVSARVIAVLSPAYLASPYTRAEWADVVRRDPTGEKRLLIPVKVAPCEVDPLLGTLLWINVIGKDEQQARKVFIEGVQRPAHPGRAVAFPTGQRVTVCTIPYLRNAHFTGREAILDHLEQHLGVSAPDSSPGIRQVALTQPQAVKGLGGIGKTQIAVEYAYRVREQGQYQHILWMNAGSAQALLASCIEQAHLLPGFAAPNETNQPRLVAVFRHWLQQCQQPWLLLFDNADEITLVQSYLPREGEAVSC